MSRGPWNVGGRTRALAIDVANENRMLAGGISGGMWLSEVGPDLTAVAGRVEPARIAMKIADPALWIAQGYPAGLMPPRPDIGEGDREEIAAYLAGLAGKAYSPTGAASPWSHEGVRLGLVIALFNLGMLAALGWARRREARAGGAA